MSSLYFGLAVFCQCEARVPEFDMEPLPPPPHCVHRTLKTVSNSRTLQYLQVGILCTSSPKYNDDISLLISGISPTQRMKLFIFADTGRTYIFELIYILCNCQIKSLNLYVFAMCQGRNCAQSPTKRIRRSEFSNSLANSKLLWNMNHRTRQIGFLMPILTKNLVQVYFSGECTFPKKR